MAESLFLDMKLLLLAHSHPFNVELQFVASDQPEIFYVL